MKKAQIHTQPFESLLNHLAVCIYTHPRIGRHHKSLFQDTFSAIQQFRESSFQLHNGMFQIFSFQLHKVLVTVFATCQQKITFIAFPYHASVHRNPIVCLSIGIQKANPCFILPKNNIGIGCPYHTSIWNLYHNSSNFEKSSEMSSEAESKADCEISLNSSSLIVFTLPSIME